MKIIKTGRMDREFIDQVEKMSRSNLSVCWNCMACSGGCIFSEDMDYLPNRIVRMIQFGLKKKVLESSTIWLCVGCNNCAMECPNSLDMGAIMDALRQIALAENAKIAEPEILFFHNAVLDSIFRHGRTHKFEVMMRYKWAKKDMLSDVGLGLKMIPKGKLGFFPSRVKDRKTLRSLFQMKERFHEKN